MCTYLLPPPIFEETTKFYYSAVSIELLALLQYSKFQEI